MKRTQQHKGFTIVELLTVMAVIALLIGLLVPALALVKDRAKDIQQRAQFHAVSSGLEMFKADFGDYPESNDNAVNTASSPQKVADPIPYCGANKLAEAMIGYDYLGFHPNSDFRADGANTIINQLGVQVPNTVVYHPDYNVADWETATQNIQARKGPYVELENANAFRMDEIYTTFPGASGFSNTFVLDSLGRYPLALCDVYARKRGGIGGKKTGTPILYFRARTNFSIQDMDALPEQSIYYFYDNARILDLGMPDTGVGAPHALFTGTNNEFVSFDEMILNKNVSAVRRPYRAGSFVLWSAGKDGSFGTADDIFNFTREAE